MYENSIIKLFGLKSRKAFVKRVEKLGYNPQKARLKTEGEKERATS